MGLGGLHKVLVQDPALGLAVLRGVKEWEHGRMCSELWGPSRPYKPTDWAHLAEMGWLGCEDGGIWREMGVWEAKEVKEERDRASTTTPPNPPPPPLQAPPPPKRGKGGKATSGTTGKKRKRCKSDSDAESDRPAYSSSSSSGENSPPPKKKEEPSPTKRQRPSPPRKRRGGEKKEEGGGKEARGGEKKEGGGGGGNDPLVGTTAHVLYGGGVEVGTVTGAHTCKSGVVWVRYPNNHKLYEVERHLIFGTAEAAEAHLQKVRKDATPTTNPRATKPANPPTNPQENPQPNQNTPTNPPNPLTATQGAPALWDPETGSREV